MDLADSNSTTGEVSEVHIAATKINAHRIARIEKQCELFPELLDAIHSFSNNCRWILITESWCGDGAVCIPVIAKIASHSPNIDLVLILRNENLDFMNEHLTNGSKAIPKLICLNQLDRKVVGTWGPRPTEIQRMVNLYKAEFPMATHDEFVNNLHLWYARDRTKSIQDDFAKLINDWNTDLSI